MRPEEIEFEIADRQHGSPFRPIGDRGDPTEYITVQSRFRTLWGPDEMLTPASWPSFSGRLSMLHASSDEQAYRDAYERCAPVAGRIPKASVI